MNKRVTEIVVGLFVLLGLGSLAHLSVGLARQEVIRGPSYEIKALFSSVGGLRSGAGVTIAGVDVGSVKAITLEDHQALVTMIIDEKVDIQTDAMASVRTRGLIGEKFIAITPGGAEETLTSGGEIFETEPAVDLEQLISRFVFNAGG